MFEVADRNNNMLIIGQGATAEAAGKIVPAASQREAREKYGASNLTEASKVAFDYGVRDVYLANTPAPQQALDVVDALRDYDFAYVVPVGTFMSDYFLKRGGDRRTYYAEQFLKTLGKDSLTTLVFTDKHASLYEHIDHFLDYMLEVKDRVKNRIAGDGKLVQQNLCFVANNLKNYRFANVLAASLLCTTPLDSYPAGDFGPAVFDLDSLDVGYNEMAYFKNSHLRGTTLENLVNFSSTGDPLRYVLADRVKKYILRELDLDRFKGRLATPYQKMRAEEAVIDFLESQLNHSIERYKIDNVGLFRDSPGAKRLEVEFEIYPVNFKEKVAVRKEL